MLQIDAMDQPTRHEVVLGKDEFAARLRAGRAYLGLTIEVMAGRFQISRHALSRREAGAVEIRQAERQRMVALLTEDGVPQGLFEAADFGRAFAPRPASEESPPTD